MKSLLFGLLLLTMAHPAGAQTAPRPDRDPRIVAPPRRYPDLKMP